jgi:uncharacterized membrane protein SpoIIM required for sporulation
MIIDAARFQQKERGYWEELEAALAALDKDSARKLTLDSAQRLHYLYRRTAADLTKVRTLPGEVELNAYLESLVARAYAEIHETRSLTQFRRLGRWFTHTVPQTFRRRIRAFGVTVLLTLLGAVFGTGVVLFDYDAKPILLPFQHLHGDPSERVAKEESATEDRLEGVKATFSASLMANNIRVSIMALALGMTFAIGTCVVLFYNGVILGAVACDYITAGESTFLMGWLLPHGSVEIPAILIAGQAGIVLGHALIGWGNALDFRSRLREIRPDLVTLMFAVVILLIWAGIIEAFFSQYHEPYLPYWLKIAFGGTQLVLLFYYLLRFGRKDEEGQGTEAP